MLKPHLVYAKDSKTNDVACVASLVPTFEPPAPQEEIEVVHGQEPEMTELTPGSEYHFIFLVDRSGSMTLEGRMESAIEALKIFIRSLPAGCRFTIISFGSNFTYLEHGGKKVIQYNDASMNEAIERIGHFTADHGGTDIETPMIVAQTLDSAITAEEAGIDFKKRMFILTDGSVSSADHVINLAREMS